MADEEKKTSAKADKKPAKSKDKKSKKNPFKSIVSFFKSVKAEGKKVIWPGGKEVLKNSLTVLVVVIIAGVCIFAVDQLLTTGMKGIKNLADKETTTVSSEATASTTVANLAESTTADTTAAKK